MATTIRTQKKEGSKQQKEEKEGQKNYAGSSIAIVG
jgi:hypothetical protein